MFVASIYDVGTFEFCRAAYVRVALGAVVLSRIAPRLTERAWEAAPFTHPCN